MKQQKIIFLLVAVFAAFSSCSDVPKDMLVNISVKGLKKGTLYLQKVEDSLIVNVDSISVNTEAPFSLEANIDSPELFYLFLDRKSANPNDDRILFFGEKGVISIETSLENYFLGAKITGSASHDVLSEYQAMKKQFQNNHGTQAVIEPTSSPIRLPNWFRMLTKKTLFWTWTQSGVSSQSGEIFPTPYS